MIPCSRIVMYGALGTFVPSPVFLIMVIDVLTYIQDLVLHFQQTLALPM